MFTTFSSTPFAFDAMPQLPNARNPLELFVGRVGLRELVRDNIRMHEMAQLTTQHSDLSRLTAQLELDQLRTFEAWLDEPAQCAHPNVSVHLYPSDPPSD